MQQQVLIRNERDKDKIQHYSDSHINGNSRAPRRRKQAIAHVCYGIIHG